jgi:hypothetical protein
MVSSHRFIVSGNERTPTQDLAYCPVRNAHRDPLHTVSAFTHEQHSTGLPAIPTSAPSDNQSGTMVRTTKPR